MATNRKRYADAWQAIESLDVAEVTKIFPDGLPSQFFCLGMYSAEVRLVKSAKRHYRGIYEKDNKEKVTNAEVITITQFLNGWKPPTADDIFIHWAEIRTYGKVSGADSLSKINAGKEMAWTADQLAPEIERRKELYEPREGYAPCQYCQKQNPPENMIEGTVIYRMQRGIGRKTGMYCKDKPCASHDQMGHEG